MNKINTFIYQTQYKKFLQLGFIMVLAIISRILWFGKYPQGIHADEAYAAYEAFCISNYGIDSWGYHNPVYLTTWGSGMSTMNTYLMIPFVLIGGLNIYTIRMPQMILGILSVFLLYRIFEKIADEKLAFWAGFLMAICPWHIMLSRWGLDANLAPAFILFAIYFAVLGFEKEKYLILSFIFWGLSLYCYVLLWLFVPFFLIFSIYYCNQYNKIKINKYFITAIFFLIIIALPLILFVIINIGLLPEIQTSWISIPKLISFRSDEFTLKNIIDNIKNLFRIYIKQNDDNIMSVIPFFGLYYLFSLPFIISGALIIIKNAVYNLKNKLFGYDLFLLVWILIDIIISLLKSMCIHRANQLNLAVLFLIIIAINKMYPKIKPFLFFIYLFAFCIFESYYFTKYQDIIKEVQLVGSKEALEYAIELYEEKEINTIRISNQIRHPQVLFYTKYPVDLYRETVEWKNYPDKWVEAERIGYFVWDTNILDNSIYVLTKNEIEKFKEAGYNIKQFETCYTAYLNEQ